MILHFKKSSTIHLLVFLCLVTFTIVSALPELTQTIECLNQYISTFELKMKPELFRIFKKTFPNTLQTTIQHYNLQQGNEYTYIITGDIQAMWLRDSTNQWLPYLKLQRECPHIKSLTKGLINAQAKFIMTDPYTNAFKAFQKQLRQRPFYLNDKTEKLIFGIPVDLCRHREFATRSIWQRKWQIDSLASFLRLCYEYAKKYNDLDSVVDMDFIRALRRVVTTLDEQVKDQKFQVERKVDYYTFYRDARELAGGKIKPSSTTGMIKTGFRPSDDANQLPYNIPGNAMMATFLELVSKEILQKVEKQSVFYTMVNELDKKMQAHAVTIRQGIKNYGVVERSKADGGSVYAYEVDGMGKFRLYDDANLPSLLSLPYLGFVPMMDELYQNTRALILSKKNPFYFEQGVFKGEGSSHTPQNYIWPLALMVQALTTDSNEEIRNCLYNLQKSAVQDLMHEAFSVQNPSVITREWFAWANSFFGELIVTLERTRPEVLK